MSPDDVDRPADEPREPDPGDDGGAAAEAAPVREEPRAKDLVHSSREQLEEQLDPRTLAELASWFLRPSMAELRERAVPDDVQRGAPAKDMDEFERLAAALGFEQSDESVVARALAAIEPRAVDLLERHTRAADEILPVRPEPRLVIDETLLPAVVRAALPADGEELPAIGEPRSYEQARDIATLLAQDNAPQAVLRDLNRPVEEYERRLQRAFPPPADEEDVAVAIREALRWRPEPVPPWERMANVQALWRPFLTSPWIELVAQAKAVRQAEVEAADAQMQLEAEAGIIWRF